MIQLKLKTEYSFGQVYGPIDLMIDRLKDMGCQAAGIVDSGTWGHVAWFKACQKIGIQPLLGVERPVSFDNSILNMWFLAKNEAGLKELYRATSKQLYQVDILIMSDDILKFAGDVTDGVFLMNVGAIVDLSPASRILNAKKKQIADKYSLPIVSVSDNSYMIKDDIEIFDLISKLKVTPQHIIKELEYQNEALTIAKKCEGLKLPKAPMIQAEGDLEKMCCEGLSKRFGGSMPLFLLEEYNRRLIYELDLIRSKDFDSYFIIVADMVRYAKQHMLVGPSRGSAAGSLVCYLLGITEVDPLKAGLYFERFIDINRTDLPDIDLDFPDKKRQMVFDYMAEKYGKNKTAHIGTISRYRPKSALIDICKALGIPPSETSAVKFAIVDRAAGDQRYNKCLEDTFTSTAPGKDFMNDYPLAAKISAKLEGHARHTGVHAAGLLICDDEITNYATVDVNGIAHVEKSAAETLGLLKIDVLGLRTLSILEEIDVDWYNLPLDDPKVFDIFNSGKLCGIFQFEGNAMRNVNKDIHFESIEDINATVALARPGPLSSGIDKKFIDRKNGFVSNYSLIHPCLKETYGLPVYQEQTMAIVHDIGGFNWEDTIEIRKAIAKSKGKEAIDKYLDQFLVGAKKNGLKEKDARRIWDVINEMGAYQMNKAHTYSYAVISYWTAYFKAHHPLEFVAANLRNAKDNDAAIMLLREGYDYVPFDLDLSEENWCVKDGRIIGGFTNLKGVGKVKAKKLIEARDFLTAKQIEFLNKAENPFSDLFPFHHRYQHLYDDPKSHDIMSDVVDIIDIDDVPHCKSRVFLGELIFKAARNENEAVNIKKRDGALATGPLDYVNVRLRDDTGEIGGRIGVRDFHRIGRSLLNDIPIGAHLVVRAIFYNNINWAFITKWRRIDTHQE